MINARTTSDAKGAQMSKNVEKTNEDNKALKEANDLLTKELKMYKERLLIFGNKPVNNTVLKKDYDQLETQFLVEKQKNEDLEKEKRNKLDETSKQNEILKDRLLEATLPKDVRNLVITSCVEIEKKNLREEFASFSKKSKDVSNESQTVDKFCASLQIENAHLKQTYLNQFKIQGLKLINKKNLPESETCVLQIKIVKLGKTLAKQTKENSDLFMKIDNLENTFAIELKRETTGNMTHFDEENFVFGS
ncbi:hypothetical protein Tco_0938916 [Tanacetum coccineum]|uniref:Uncharacterized protein n=1 Tax=Tanacetum coccineum TaxID=301880 RepID=A0ABQ5DIK1_9ASTR